MPWINSGGELLMNVVVVVFVILLVSHHGSCVTTTSAKKDATMGILSSSGSTRMRRSFSTSSRTGRLFPYLALAKYPNEVCTTEAGEGICLSGYECKKRGVSIGPCGQGFGHCCTVTKKCTETQNEVTVKDNLIILTNPLSSEKTCRFIIPKVMYSCQVRLDFNEFDIADAEYTGYCNIESLTISGSSTLKDDIRVCGNLTEQHMYLSYGKSEKILLDFRSRASFDAPNMKYNIKVTHIPCNSPHRAPEHCLQHFVKPDGTVKSFNYPKQQLNNQLYTVCVKADARSNYIDWKACEGDEFPFTVSGGPGIPDPTPRLGCKFKDHVQIFGDNQQCGDRFSPIRSFAKPFVMHVNFDDMELPDVPAPMDVPAADAETCAALSIPARLKCEWQTAPMSMSVCICQFEQVNLGDDRNSGFCLDYTQGSQ